MHEREKHTKAAIKVLLIFREYPPLQNAKQKIISKIAPIRAKGKGKYGAQSGIIEQQSIIKEETRSARKLLMHSQNNNLVVFFIIHPANINTKKKTSQGVRENEYVDISKSRCLGNSKNQ